VMASPNYARDNVKVNVPFEFTAGGRSLPSGQYEFSPSVDNNKIRIVGAAGNEVLALVITRLSKEMHTTPADAHVVFDVEGGKHYLSEIWILGMDGFLLSSPSAKHTHEILNAPVK
jgi:hypothetical protein